MKYTHVIWDWNGTLLDDIALCFDVMNGLLQRRGKPPLEGIRAYQEAFCFPVIEYYRAVGLDLEAEPFDALADEWMRAYSARDDDMCALFPDAMDAAAAIREMGLGQVVLSASKIENLVRQVRAHAPGLPVEGLYGIADIYASGKEELALRWREEMPGANPLFVGDTEHDAQVAAAAGADCLLVARGHQGEERLRGCSVPILSTLAEVPGWILSQ